MKKHLYEIKRLDIPAYLKWWFIKYRNAGTLSEVLENLTSPITLTNSLKRKFKIFEIGGNSVQDGEPSPTNEVPIQNVTGNVEVKVENKNFITGLYYISADSLNFYFDKNNVNSSMIFSGIIDKTLNRVASIYIGGVGGTIAVALNITINANQKFSVPVILTQEQINRIKNSARPYIQIYRSSASSVDLSTSIYSEIQLEEGSTATDYAPHEQQTAIFPLEEGQRLHKDDTIEDKIVQRRKTLVFDGTENWSVTGNRFRLILNDAPIPIRGGVNILCNYYKRTYNYNENGIFLSDSWFNTTTKFLVIVDSSFSTLEDFKNWLAEKYANGTPLTLEYELETPLKTEFTEAQRTAKAQIDKLYSYKGTTHISSTNDPSPLFTIQYVKEET